MFLQKPYSPENTRTVNEAAGFVICVIEDVHEMHLC